MRLAELEALEAEQAKRGYVVAFTVAVAGGHAEQPQHLTRDDDTGWPTGEEAWRIAERLRALSQPRWSEIRVVAPNGEEWLPAAYRPAVDAPASFSNPLPSPRDEPAAESGVQQPAPTGLITLLAENGTQCILGDAQGRVTLAPRATLASLAHKGRLGPPPSRTAFDQMLIGDVPLVFERVTAAPDLAIEVAFWSGGGEGAGAWFVKQAVDSAGGS